MKKFSVMFRLTATDTEGRVHDIGMTSEIGRLLRVSKKLQGDGLTTKIEGVAKEIA